DLVVTIALGSTLATIILSRDTPLIDGLLALATLIAMQYVVAWIGVRSAGFRGLVKNDPTLLFYQGAFLEAALRRARVTRDEVLASVRGAQIEDLADIRAVVLETDGSISVVVGRGGRPTDSALASLPASP
ncbi:MAG: YetF domain-containing protein, partial [Gemmatimonadales bacterium]